MRNRGDSRTGGLGKGGRGGVFDAPGFLLGLPGLRRLSPATLPSLLSRLTSIRGGQPSLRAAQGVRAQPRGPHPGRASMERQTKATAQEACFEASDGDPIARNGMSNGCQGLAKADAKAGQVANPSRGGIGGCFPGRDRTVRKLPQTRPAASGRALHEQDLVAATHHDRDFRHFHDLFAICGDRHVVLDPLGLGRAKAGEGAAPAAWLAGRADQRAQLHQRLIEVSHAPPRQQLLRRLPELVLQLRSLRIAPAGEEPAQDADAVRLKNWKPAIERLRQDRPERVAADARQPAERLRIVRHPVAMLPNEDLRGPVQVACPAIVA